ncbi:family 43 glycosylhydrolase [Solwaraspora sp. WMMD792]|uniref:family 43 glycosylhydrolase n=1 Tax=Solwaraspora sp. WMMD792 TaxID=3016099 RepID=UPI002417D898|nr:family 43 glycosylhydrolase [Solwaraspora sp. WMMD792]MDG4774502.1 family 43 glycosylhydrolase [Solwaraspora sp. WMMD792]
MRQTAVKRAALLAAAGGLVASAATVVLPATAAAAAGCSVDYAVSSQWPGGFGANVTVTNLGDPIDGWTLTWSYTAGQQVTQAWNTSLTQSGAQVTARNVSWNSAIATNGTASFGFNGSWNNSSNPTPGSFTLNGTVCTGGVTDPTTAPPTTVPPTTAPPTTAPPTTAPPTTPPPSGDYTNPVVWQDFADVEVIRVDDTYYMTASTMHYSPGAPILRSYDLVNWEFAGHAVPRLEFGSKYDLSGAQRGYVRGIWASTLNYRRSNGTYYWAGCIDFSQTHMFTSRSVEGPWTKHATLPCYYDAGLLFDDDDTPYVAYGNGTISVAQLSADGRSQVRAQQVFQTPSSVGTLEGARFYKRNGSYYIWLTRPANGQYVLRSTNGPFGPYEMRQVLLDLPGPISGGGVPHQGGLVQTQNGDWYYMAFVDAYPGGRMPALAPISWTGDGWPQLRTVNGRWGVNYPVPNLPAPPRVVKPLTGVDTFAGTALGPQWEWNHNPDNSRWSVNDGLRLSTATVTNDLYSARNTLTHRIQGPTSTATVELDYSSMRDGDRSGLVMLRQSSAWVGVRRDNGSTRVVMTNGLTMDSNWNTTGTGTEVASAPVSGGRVWLRANADIRPGAGRQARFSYSTDGVNFTSFGPAFTLNNEWQFFMGYRFGIFNYATQALGGAVTVRRFELTTP